MHHYYGSDDDGGFNATSKAYKANPTIENYVKLRRETPDAEIEVSIFGGIDELLFMEKELKTYGFDELFIANVMDANQGAISELSLQLMERIIASRRLSKGGRTHLGRRGLAVPDKLIDWLIVVMLDALSWNDSLCIPRDLIVLIRERSSGSNPHYKKAGRAHQKRRNAIMIGGQLMASGVTPSYRLLAKYLDVAPSTVKRWFADGDFLRKIERASHLFDETGRPRETK